MLFVSLLSILTHMREKKVKTNLFILCLRCNDSRFLMLVCDFEYPTGGDKEFLT